MKCSLLILDSSGDQQVAGTIKLTGKGRIKGKAVAGHERLMATVLAHPNIVDGGASSVTVEGDPQRWFEALPTEYNGTYLRAQIL
jgi:hypothetical protein